MHNFYISLFRIKYKYTCIYILIHLPIVKISSYSIHLNHMVSALTNPVAISYEKCCCRMPYLSNDECNRVVTMLLQGATQQEVATALGVHQTTVHRLHGRLVHFGNTDDKSRSGRPRVTTARQDRLMRLTHLRNRTRTAVETAITTPGTNNHRISAQTVPKTPRILVSEHIVQMLEIHLLLADDLRACNG